jgi:hypothetical protein
VTTEVSLPERTAPRSIQPTLEPKAAWKKWAVAVWLFGIVAFHLGSAARGYSLYRDIHMGAVLDYARGPINLFKPVITGFNLNGVPTPQELPVWQATAGLALKVLGTWFGWANCVSLLFMASCLYPLFDLARRFGGSDCGWWTLILFLSQPLIVIYAGLASPDGFSLAVTIWFMFFATKIWNDPSPKWAVLAGLTGALAAVSKLPFFMAAGLACALMTLFPGASSSGQGKPVSQRRLSFLWLTVAAIFAGAVFVAWTKYQHHVFAQAEMPLEDLRVSNSRMAWWYFGDLRERLTPGVWIKGAWRISGALFGSFSLISLFLLALAWQPPSRLAVCWLVGGVITTFTFFNLVLQHTHYYLMFAPAVAILCAQVAARLELGLLSARGRRSFFVPAILMAALALSTIQGLIERHTIGYFDKYPHAVAALIKSHTMPSDKLVIQGGGWGGQMLFLSDRRGLSVWGSELLEDRKTYDRLKSLGFTKLVMISESPLYGALRHFSSTSPTLDRESYQNHTSPIVEKLPTVLQNEDILIKELP